MMKVAIKTALRTDKAEMNLCLILVSATMLEKAILLQEDHPSHFGVLVGLNTVEINPAGYLITTLI